MLKIATWNVNSLRVRLNHVLTWLADNQPDVLVLQETKIVDADFPNVELEQAGYTAVYSGQRTYNGVAILSRIRGTDIVTDFSALADPQRRILGVTLGDIRILNVYIPNGESVVSEKYLYKLNWLTHLTSYLEQQLKTYPRLAIMGDFNIAPSDLDVHDPAAWAGKVLFSDKERAAFQGFLDLGLIDCFRQQQPNEKQFTWWDYRLNAFKRNLGLRIDHILASPGLAQHCSRCYIDKTPRSWERPSDHAPVVAEFMI